MPQPRPCLDPLNTVSGKERGTCQQSPAYSRASISDAAETLLKTCGHRQEESPVGGVLTDGVKDRVAG